MDKNKRVLLVEDNADNRMLIFDLLETLGVEVISAVNGEEGVRLALSAQPAMILMDLSLPVKDGWQATREIKAHPETKHIPVIALTAHAMIGDRERALAVGCDDYLTKPIKMGELLGKVRSVLALE